MPQPNILWISLEDTSPRFGCYGDPVARTPNLDKLAAQGCLYPNAFSTAGVCAPSRACIITGIYATSMGAQQMRTQHPPIPNRPGSYDVVLPHYAKLLPEYLRHAGYFCTNNEKTDYQFAAPFTAWDENGNQAHWRNRPDKDQPFFAVFNPVYTHESKMWESDEPLVTDPDAVIAKQPGKVAILHYLARFQTPGRYYVWARAYSTGSEDNGIHVGIDGEWPESGQRMQWCQGKNSWRWESKQRTDANHCGEAFKIFLDVDKVGEHEIMVSMREDGFELDKLLLINARDLRPEGPLPTLIQAEEKPEANAG